MIKFLVSKSIASHRFGAGAVAGFNSETETELIARGEAEAFELISIHPYYHFHGFAGNQIAGDSKFFDMSAGNHGVRGANLSDAGMFATAGYMSTVNPKVGVADSTIHIPPINFDYAGGERLIVWWLGAATPEGG